MKKKKYVSKTGKVEDAEKARLRMKKYNKTPAGRKARAEYRERNRAKLRIYMREYFKKRRAKAEKLGLCANCMKEKRIGGTVFCLKCRTMVRKNAFNQKRRNRKMETSTNKRKNTTKKEREAAELWEYIKKRDYSGPKEPLDIDKAVKHLKEALEEVK